MIHHFSGRSILVAEDDYYLAMDVKAALLAIGVRPLGPAPDPEKALLFIGATDIAVIDVELRDGTNGCTIADALDHQGTPFIFVTGYADRTPSRHHGRPICHKPANEAGVLGALTDALRDRF